MERQEKKKKKSSILAAAKDICFQVHKTDSQRSPRETQRDGRLLLKRMPSRTSIMETSPPPRNTNTESAIWTLTLLATPDPSSTPHADAEEVTRLRGSRGRASLPERRHSRAFRPEPAVALAALRDLCLNFGRVPATPGQAPQRLRLCWKYTVEKERCATLTGRKGTMSRVVRGLKATRGYARLREARLLVYLCD